VATVRGLLDTSVVIATEVVDLPDEAAISAATLAELHFGVHLAKDEQTRALRLRRLTEIESRFAALPIDETVARAYGELAAVTVLAGRKVRSRVVDLFIAATARVHGVPLYTRNPADFQPFADRIEIREA
jgi:predicted nucleic acid-binding protein